MCGPAASVCRVVACSSSHPPTPHSRPWKPLTPSAIISSRVRCADTLRNLLTQICSQPGPKEAAGLSHSVTPRKTSSRCPEKERPHLIRQRALGVHFWPVSADNASVLECLQDWTNWRGGAPTVWRGGELQRRRGAAEIIFITLSKQQAPTRRGFSSRL